MLTFNNYSRHIDNRSETSVTSILNIRKICLKIEPSGIHLAFSPVVHTKRLINISTVYVAMDFV